MTKRTKLIYLISQFLNADFQYHQYVSKSHKQLLHSNVAIKLFRKYDDKCNKTAYQANQYFRNMPVKLVGQLLSMKTMSNNILLISDVHEYHPKYLYEDIEKLCKI